VCAGRALRGAVAMLVSALLTCTPAAAEPSRDAEAILAVQVNLEAKGEFLVRLTPDGDVLVREEDLAALGLGALARERILVEGIPHAPLSSLPALTFNVDMDRLVLALRVEPRQLDRLQVLDFGPRRDAQVLRPQPAGAFFNYYLTHHREPQRSFFEAAIEAGARFGEYLFISDGYSNVDPATGERRHVRLSTTAVRDRRETLEQLAVGDFVTRQTGPLGSSLRLGGVSFSRRYSIDPYYVQFPGQVVTGTAALPSEIFVYSNGVLVRRERVAPGGFELRNLVNLPGLQVTEVVVRDVLGNEHRIVDPFYFSDALLRPGLDEYSVDAGFERRQFGLRSGDYGKPGAAGFYRRGITPALTLGAHGEALDRRYNLGPQAVFGLGLAGVTSLGFAYGSSERQRGWALSAAHAYHSRRWSANAAVRLEERGYTRAAADLFGARRYDLSATLSHAVTPHSSLSFGASATALWDAAASRSAALSYRMRALRDVYVTATARRLSGALRSDELFLTLSWHFDAAGMRHLAGLQLRHDDSGTGALAQLSGGNPLSEGLLYRVSAQSTPQSDGARRTLNPAAQWNGRHAVLRAEAFADTQGDERTQLGLQGGIATVGGEWALSRPVGDSFAIVKVGDAAGVRVYANNQPVATTGTRGTAFVPRLASYFENPVAIEDQDLPFNYLVPRARFVVSPALRSGVLLDFRARAVTAVAGRLVAVVEGADAPFSGARGALNVQGEPRELLTASDGSFYLEDVPPGRYEGEATREGASCRFSLQVVPSTEVVADLGEVHCAH
jgi:outer membrane usher protein